MPKKKILIVDDEVSITKLLKYALERSGRYEVHCENEGANIFPAIRSFLPDIIILDVNLPDAQGGDISASLQEDPTLQKIPVIFLTGMISQEEVQSGLTIAGRPAVAKPVNFEVLIQCIEANLPK